MQRGWRSMRKRSHMPPVPVLTTLTSVRETSPAPFLFCNAKDSPLLLLPVPFVCRTLMPASSVHRWTCTARRRADSRMTILPRFPHFPACPGWLPAAATHWGAQPAQRAALVTYFKDASLSILDSSCLEDYWREEWVFIPQGTSLGFMPPPFPSL